MSDDNQSSGVAITEAQTLVEAFASPKHMKGRDEPVRETANSSLVARLIHQSRERRSLSASLVGDQEASVDDTLAPGSLGSLVQREYEESMSAKEGASEFSFESLLRTSERYEFAGKLGSGGMGNVSRVKDHMLNRSLAMKTLHPHLLSKDGLVLRFIHEAQVVSQLQHPNILPVYDIGVLRNGQLYFTMAEIQGDSLDKFIKRLHRMPALVENDESREEWNLYRLVNVFHDVCKAIAYANERGVIHRDLKPANIMIGALGEVLVVDWGLAKVVGAQEAVRDEIVTAKTDSNTDLTMLGAIYGTPGYLAPELATGDGSLPCPTTDVYALGAILYEVLTGVRAFSGTVPNEVLAKALSGAVRPFDVAHTSGQTLGGITEDELEHRRYVSPQGLKIPTVLAEVCLKSLSFAPIRRYQSVRELVDILGSWLDGTRRQEKATDLVERAHALESQIKQTERGASDLEDEAAEMMAAVDPWADETQKVLGWSLQDEAQSLRLKSGSLRTKQIQLLRNALSYQGNLPAAHAALANRFRSLHRVAEAEADLLEAARTKMLMTEHVRALSSDHPLRAELVAYLKGIGTFSLETQPPGAVVSIASIDMKNRRLIPGQFKPFDRSPMHERSLKMGSYLLCIQAEGYDDTVYPVYVDRTGVVDGRDPNGEPHPIELLRKGTLGADDCYVPAGWCHLGGDPNTPNSLPRQRVWIDGFVIRRFSVTNAEYLTFLNDLVNVGRQAEAREYVPREQSSLEGELGQMTYIENDEGQFELDTSAEAGLWHPRQPVTLIQWRSARAYAQWFAEQTGLPWRLPMEFEWEKAARGVDGRFYPWGNTHDPSWSCMKDSHEDQIRMQSVDSYPLDESVYGVRGTAGNTRDWCLDRFEENGPALSHGRLMMPSIADLSDPGFKSTRGGSYGNSASRARSADRDWWFPNRSYIGRGFRLAWGLADRPSVEDNQ